MRYHLLTSFAALLLGLSMHAQPVTCIDCELIDPNAICPAIYDPVCGCDGITYSNSCVAESSAGILYYAAGECPMNNVSSCMDLEGVDFGPCDMVLGFGMINGECQSISGCSTIGSDEVDYGGAIFPEPEMCSEACQCGGGSSSVPEEGLTEVSISLDALRSTLTVFYNLNESLNCSLYDLSGRKVMQEIISSGQELALSELESGVYLIELQLNGRSVHSQKLMIKR